MKNAIILNGTPRINNGNTAVLVNWCNEILSKKDYQVQQLNLYKMDVKGCAHCDACKRNPTEPACILKDDFSEILYKIADSDLIIIASPVYCWSISGCMSSALDRFYAFFKKDSKSLIKGKRILGIFTSGGDISHGADLCISMLKQLCTYGHANHVGVAYADNCKDPQQVASRIDIKQHMASLI